MAGTNENENLVGPVFQTGHIVRRPDISGRDGSVLRQFDQEASLEDGKKVDWTKWEFVPGKTDAIRNRQASGIVAVRSEGGKFALSVTAENIAGLTGPAARPVNVGDRADQIRGENVQVGTGL